jgi:dTDP-glucose pyrophosphorylase
MIITNFEEHACAPDTVLRDVLVRIDRSPYLFQVVLDQAGKLCGTVTDGDIRRAILHGIALDASVTAAMQRNPIFGRLGDREANSEKVGKTGSSRAFLPVVDDDGVLREIVIGRLGDRENAIQMALVMAGGAGVRLGERTRNLPKPLLPVGGRPILEHVLDRLETSGISHILVSVHYLAEKIEEYLNRRPSRATIQLLREKNRLGTAGAIGQINIGIGSKPLLVVNGDVLTSVDYRALHDFHVQHRLDATVAVSRYDIDVPFGVVRYGADGLFVGIEEKPRITNFIAAGVYYLSPQFVGLVPNGQPIDMPELLNLGRNIGLKIGVFPIHEYWTDVGRPDDLARAEDRHRASSAT